MAAQAAPTEAEIEAVLEWARTLVGLGDFETEQEALYNQFQTVERVLCACLWANAPVPVPVLRQWGAYLKAMGGDPVASAPTWALEAGPDEGA